MYEGVDTVVLQNELAYQDLLPVGWRPLAGDAGPSHGHQPRRGQCPHPAGVRGHRGAGCPREEGRQIPAFRRHHAAGSEDEPAAGSRGGNCLPLRSRAPPARLIRFNALGAAWKSAVPLQAGQQGLLDIYLRDSLPQPLTLIARITQVNPDGHVRAAFAPPGEGDSGPDREAGVSPASTSGGRRPTAAPQHRN